MRHRSTSPARSRDAITSWLSWAGLVGLTVAFVAAHSVASTWVSRRALHGRAQASALYLLAYYPGSSAGGSLGGVASGLGEWPAVVAYVALLLLAALALAVRLRRLPPARPASPTGRERPVRLASRAPGSPGG